MVAQSRLGDVEQSRDPLQLTALRGGPGHADRQPGIGADDRLTQLVAELQVRRGRALLQELVLGRQQHGRRSLPVPGGRQQAHRLVHLPGRQIPVRGPAKQLGNGLGCGCSQLTDQHVPEKPVVSVPLAVSIQWDDEEVGPLERFQDGRRPGAAEHGVAQRPGQPIEDRGPDQERPPVGGQSIQHLRGEEVDDVPVVAGRRGASPPGRRNREGSARPA